MATSSAPTADRPAGFDKLVALINLNSSTPLLAGQLDVGLPATVAGDSTGLATTVNVSATTDSPYVGGVDFSYNRLDMNVVLTRPPGADPVITYRQMTQASFLEGLNALHGSALTGTDLGAPFNMTQAAVDTTTVAVVSHPNSLTLANTANIDTLFVPIEELESSAASFLAFAQSLSTTFKGK